MHRPLDTNPVAPQLNPLRKAAGSDVAAHALAVDGRFLSRGGRRFPLRGVAYGPFAPNRDGHPFPEMEVAVCDFAKMKATGLNAVRIYHLPPPKLLDAAHEHELGVMIDVPWSKHLCFLHSSRACGDARAAVESAARKYSDSPAVLALSIANEIPADVVRWHGAKRVERFLRELADAARQADPQRLLTYGNYPPTEYLDLSFLDFATFNVYLHDRETFRRYLLRLMNLVNDRPLVLGELGMDTLRNGEEVQSQFLSGHLREIALAGLAGSFVFSWTDEWFTGRHAIEDWAFGVTRADRSPKKSYQALGAACAHEPLDLLPSRPRVSVVVCSYNGGATLAPCLESLSSLNYPDYEVVLVDDGSTDDTQSIAARYSGVRVIRQENEGLSAARNAGLKAATGLIIAYTDSDCVAHPDWLTFLVAQMLRSGASAVGGPNRAPAGQLATCVAAAPGQPMHVLESDQVAEHIPGCNMAFRRQALEAVNGFDPQFRKAGDDVDICWRLQAAGAWISFAPAAMVWHRRRPTPRAYLRQQAGYGEAEALLRFKHPDRFNFRGQGKWSGMLYGASLQGLVLDQAIVYHGTFGTGPFQCIYQPGPAHWAMVPSTLEWHMAAAAVLLLGFFWWPLFAVVGGMLAASLCVAAMQGRQAKLPRGHESLKSRTCVAALCYLQPLVRAWARYRRRYFAFQTPAAPSLEKPAKSVNPATSRRMAAYWGAGSPERTELIRRLIAYLDVRRCGKTIDTGWSDTDLYVFRDVWAVVAIGTVQEEHGGGNRVIRVRFRLRASTLTKIAIVLGAALVSLAALVHPAVAAAWAAGIGLLLAAAWYRGAGLLGKLSEVVDGLAREMSLVRVHPDHEARGAAVPAADSRRDARTTPAVDSRRDARATSSLGPSAACGAGLMSGGAGDSLLDRPSTASFGARRLIVNADDFGLSPGVNAGIIAAHERGIVTSASLMVRWPAALEATRYAAEHPRLSLGLHLDLGEWTFTQGEWRAVYEVVPADDAVATAAEVARQLEQFRALAGTYPTHIDSHQHVHRGQPVLAAVLEMAAEIDAVVRGYTPHIEYCGGFYGQDGEGGPWPAGISREGLMQLLENLRPGITELGCHPGWDDDLRTMYCRERRREVDVLCDPQVAAAIDRLGIRRISFAEAGEEEFKTSNLKSI